jgi:hypothetical protein
MGRFMSGDPLGSSADTSDLQTLNRYASVRDNPINLVDPTGLDCISSEGSDADCTSADELPVYAYTISTTVYGLPGTSLTVYGLSFDTGTSIYQSVDVGTLVPPGPPQRPQAPQTSQSAQCTLTAPGGKYTVKAGESARFQKQMSDDLTTAFRQLNSQGIVPVIVSGFRSQADQDALRNGGSGPNPAATVSWHQVGMAVDLRDGSSSAIKTAMQARGLTWGGNFKPKDPNHFQSAPAGTSPTPAMVKACGGG